MQNLPLINIGIVGTGYISRHFYLAFQNRPNFKIEKVLTRRDVKQCPEFPNQEILTNSINALLDTCSLIYECSGDPIYAADIIQHAIAANIPVVTTNSEFHVTAGSYFADSGLITEANGDQPGSLAMLHENALSMGFRPLAYANMKGFLNTNPSAEEMHFWAEKQGISLVNVTSFTDGTKIQIEQALVANGCGASFAKPGMLGLEVNDTQTAAHLFAQEAKQIGQPISDYIIFPGAPHGVFIVAEHDAAQRDMLRYVKMGDGPYYVLRQDAILLHLEVAGTIERFFYERKPLLTNSTYPSINVATVAKKPLKPGTQLKHAIGSFDVRGVGMKIVDNPDALPIGLAANMRIKNHIEPNQTLTFADVELPQTLALKAWKTTRDKVVATGNVHKTMNEISDPLEC